MSRSTVLVIRGVVGLLAALAILVRPYPTVFVLIVVFGLFALAFGIATLWLGLVSTPTSQRLWAPSLEGVVGIAAGMFALLWWPSLSPETLLRAIAVWAMATGILEFFSALGLRRVMEGISVLWIVGALSVVFGATLYLLGDLSEIIIAWSLGGYALLVGILMTGLGLHARRLTANRV
jgi:uncharacterized membrane protein HdeD (DUF308 family)